MISLFVYHLYSRKEYESKTRKEVKYPISEKVRNGLLDVEVFSKVRVAAWVEVTHQLIDDLKD
jgi:hypothetical protein